MSSPLRIAKLASLFAALALASPAVGQTLYSQDFDVDDTANWTVNGGPSDESADFFFDYSTLGIPAAPNSAGGSTRGVKLQANVFDGIFGGMSVSPNGQSFTGDYSMTFDWWENSLGPLDVGATGSTQLGQFGIQTSGTFANWPGSADGTFFAITGDGGSAVDYRIYSIERSVSYQFPANTDINGDMIPDSMDGLGQPIDDHATYLAASRNNTAALYATAFPGNQSAPTLQQTTYASQTGATQAGAAGFAWNAMEIRKVGNIVSLFANGVEILKVDQTNYVTPNAGTNILLGHADINAGTNQVDPNFATLEFSLFDNLKVTALTTPSNDADFDNDSDVDNTDLATWIATFGGAATATTGDATGDNLADGADFLAWQQQYTGPAGASAVPEPATWAAAVVALAALAMHAAPRRQAARAAVR